MKKIFPLLIFLSTSFLIAFAQQPPNAGFETWTQPVNPDSWSSIENALGLNTNTFTFKDGSTFTEGTASCKLVCDTLAGHPGYGVISPVLSLGTTRLDNINGIVYSGIPFTYRPDSLIFDYKYTSTGTDTAAVIITLTRNFINKVINFTQTLSVSANWTHVAIPLTLHYMNPSTPDTLEIQFTPSNANQPVQGSTLHVDGVKLGYISQSHVPTATILAGGPLTFCNGGYVILHADSNTGYTFQWKVGGTTIPGATTSQYVASSSGSYTVQVDSASITATSAAKVVTVNQAAVSLTGLNDTVCNNASAITLNGGSPAGGTYAGSGIIASTFTPSTATLGLDTIQYTATDANSCTGTVSATVFVEVCTGINNIAATTFSVFPNPANSILNIRSNYDMSGFILQMFDITGRFVKSQMLTDTNNTFDVTKFASGAYVYHITDKGNNVIATGKCNIVK